MIGRKCIEYVFGWNLAHFYIKIATKLKHDLQFATGLRCVQVTGTVVNLCYAVYVNVSHVKINFNIEKVKEFI